LFGLVLGFKDTIQVLETLRDLKIINKIDIYSSVVEQTRVNSGSLGLGPN